VTTFYHGQIIGMNSDPSSGYEDRKEWYCCATWFCLAPGLLLLLILTPISYVTLEYYEVGLKTYKATGKVYENKVSLGLPCRPTEADW
jgi:hypothetical protein